MHNQPLNPLVAPAQMMFAAMEGDLDRCQSLIQRGADVRTIADSHGRTPLHEAAERGHVDVCRLLLESGADPNLADESGATPFHSAAGQGGLSICRLLVEHGADVVPLRSLRVKDGALTPLQLAVIGGQIDVVRYFVEECDADLDQVANDGKKLTRLAWEFSKLKMAEFLGPYWNAIKTEQSISDALQVGDAGTSSSRSRGPSPL